MLKTKEKSIVVVARKHLHNFYSVLSGGGTKVSVMHFTRTFEGIHKINADIVLLDCGSDGADGLQWLSEFKKVRKDTPVIFITSVRSHDIVMSAYKLGVRDYFTKPVSISELNRIITALMSLKKISSEKRISLPCKPAHVSCKLTNAMMSDIPANIACAVHYIEENSSKLVSLSKIAEQANLSKYHFTRIFKRLTGFSPLEYMIILRMHKAKKLLEENELHISGIAEEVGYPDLRNFNRRFKQHTGITPSLYRKKFS